MWAFASVWPAAMKDTPSSPFIWRMTREKLTSSCAPTSFDMSYELKSFPGEKAIEVIAVEL